VANHHARLPSVSLVNEYGPTEGTVWCSAAVLTATRPYQVIPIGRAIDNVHLSVLDPWLRPVAVGVHGELWIGGEALARGYLNRPDLTADRFLPDPFSGKPGARLYRTGDRVRWTTEGELQFLGRLDHQVKIRGFRIELEEIELALTALAEVREAAVVVREDASGNPRVVAYVTGDVLVDELRRTLGQRLPSYMVPAVFVVLAALPLTPNGKVDRKALPPPPSPTSEEAYLAPATPIEELLSDLWAELFGLGRVGVADDFFALGGHSLLAVRLMARIEHAFGLKLPLSVLFEAPTIRHLARAIQGAPLRRSALVRLHPGGAGRPLFLVHPAGGDVFDYRELASKLGTDRPVYGLQAVAEESTHSPSMEGMAAQYLASVREAQPDGPWLLAGWSSGAVLAYEMARQIESSGGATSLLALFDPPPPGRRSEDVGNETLLLAAFAALAAPSEQQRGAIREMLQGLDVEAGLDRLLELARAQGVLPGVSRPWLRERFELFSRTMTALQSYVPGPYGGRVILFRAGASIAPEATDLTSGWGLLARTEAHLIPDANHISLLKMPALGRLVKYLQRDLAMVEG
jgi:thioesterase domain-containing protein/acyl carrier protein